MEYGALYMDGIKVSIYGDKQTPINGDKGNGGSGLGQENKPRVRKRE